MKVNPAVVVKENFDGHGIFYDTQTRKLMRTNDVGITIWNAIKDGGDLDAIVSAVTKKFAVSSAQAKKDASAFIDKMVEQGLIQK